MDATVPHGPFGSDASQVGGGRRFRRGFRHLAAAVLACAAPFGARAADPLPYTVSLAKTGNGPLDAALAASLQLSALRSRAPAGPFAVLSRARQGVPRLTTALE